MKHSQKGFGAVEGLLVLIIVLLIGFIGYYVYHTRNNTNSTYNNAANVSQSGSHLPKSLTSTDSEAIKEAVKNDCEAIRGNSAKSIVIGKQEGNYVVASVNCGTADFSPTNRDYLKKTNDTWAVVVKGGGAPTTDQDLAPYGFPADFLQ